MHVLIVDDEPFAREELAYLVKQHPQVTSIAQADSVDQAIAQLIDKKNGLALFRYSFNRRKWL